jgi:hypothetical protein
MMDPMCPDEGWHGMYGTMAFNVTVTNTPQGYGTVIAPHDVARIISMDVCKLPIRIRNGFYEYLTFGTGLQPKTCVQSGCGATLQAFQRDTVHTLAEFEGDPQYVRIYPTDSADVGKRVVIQGPDQNGKTVLGVDTDTGEATIGELVYLNLPFVTTTNQFTGPLTGIQKDVTNGPVQLFQVDVALSDESVLSTMEPNEITAEYRKYLINGLPCNCCDTAVGTVQVTCQVRFDFVPVLSDSDYLLIQNVPALIEECQSIRYGRQDSASSMQLSGTHHIAALRLLMGQLDAYEGKINPAISVPIFGSDRLRRQPV